MAITIIWDNSEHSIIRMTFPATWTWKQMDATVAEACLMMDTVQHQVDVIIDIKNTNLIPDNAFWRFHKLTQIKHHNRGSVILVSGNGFVRTMTETVRRLADDLFEGNMFVLTASIEDARATLFKKRLQVASGF
jgi:hypothetical protein